MQSVYHTLQRYRTLRSHRISALPIVILMPHSACNCRCIMCDIWKGNKNLKQLTEADVSGLLGPLKKLGTKQVVMSGGEATLNPQFFSLCRIIKKAGMKISLLSTGLTLKKFAGEVVNHVDDVILSLDGPEAVHDRIRNIPGAFIKLAEGVREIKKQKPAFRMTARTVIHRLNYLSWPAVIDTAKQLDLNQISFLPADVSSHAFNREILWSPERQNDVLIAKEELSMIDSIVDLILANYAGDFESHFIAESPGKLKAIATYYKAIHGLAAFPLKKCNAPWVSAVVEADGAVRPCFFHAVQGNIHRQSLPSILNGEAATTFRKTLDIQANETCRRCVCSLNLSPHINPAHA